MTDEIWLPLQAMGDSTVAGQDNCAFDSWPRGLARHLVPMFAAAGVNVTVRNVGHNGGWPTVRT